MSKKFVKGNIYVFTKKKFLKMGYGKRLEWVKKINGRQVTITGKYDGYVDEFIVDPEWCKCIGKEVE